MIVFFMLPFSIWAYDKYSYQSGSRSILSKEIFSPSSKHLVLTFPLKHFSYALSILLFSELFLFVFRKGQFDLLAHHLFLQNVHLYFIALHFQFVTSFWMEKWILKFCNKCNISSELYTSLYFPMTFIIELNASYFLA